MIFIFCNAFSQTGIDSLLIEHAYSYTDFSDPLLNTRTETNYDSSGNIVSIVISLWNGSMFVPYERELRS